MLPGANTNVQWLAGLLDGEGCFTTCRGKDRKYYTPEIHLSMTDRDVVERVASVWGTSVRLKGPNRPAHYKTLWETKLSGVVALEAMLNLFPFLSDRRRGRIEEILSTWEHRRSLKGYAA